MLFFVTGDCWSYVRQSLAQSYILYLESIRPIRTAENFEAVEWATGFSNKNGCIVGLIDTAAGRVTSFYVICYVILLK